MTKLTESVTAGEEMGIDVTSGGENENETFASGVIFAWMVPILETVTCDACMATIVAFCCTKICVEASENETVFVFPDCATLIWSMTGSVNENQTIWTYCACALSCHVILFFHLSVTVILSGSWNAPFLCPFPQQFLF